MKKEAATSLGDRIKFIATVIGIASPILALATFIGLKPEKRKAIEWEYVAKGSLVNATTASPDKVEVTYEGRKIKQLTTLSGRLSNLGAIPIDGSDIKDGAMPSLTFSIPVIAAEVKGYNRDGIKASIATDKSTVRIEHGLLNPGDSIGVQILIDGDPGEIASLPKLKCRILGIEEPQTRYPANSAPKIGVTYFRLPPAGEYLVLITASIFSLFILVMPFIVGADVFKSPSKSLANALLQTRKEIPPLKAAEAVKSRFASAVFIKFPSPKDTRAREIVNSVIVEADDSPEDVLTRCAKAVEDQLLPKSAFELIRWVDIGELIAVLMLVVFGVCLALILAGSWCRLMGIS